MSNAQASFDVLTTQIGNEDGPGDWFTISQEQIDQFADATLDHQFIHVDPKRAAAETPFGGTIAHGFLTLSMLVHLSASIESETPPLDGLIMGVNYGFDKVRFLSPVPSGAEVRASSVMSNVVLKGTSIDLTKSYTVEIKGADKPALVADWITRMVYDS